MKAQFLFSIHVIALCSLMGLQAQTHLAKGPGQKFVPSSISDEGPVQVSQFSDENVLGINKRPDICPLDADLKRIRFCLSRCESTNTVHKPLFCFQYCQEFLYIERK